ncbi:MAG: MiaB/RimO family radical SAM methylthiotransferase [Phycisphaerales bacterium]
MTSHGRTIYLETFGCQMNELDSELVRGQLTALGYAMTADRTVADVVLYNTCSVREQAENKALSRIGIIGKEKSEGRVVVLGVIGCMAERDGVDMMRRYPQIDLLCGPGELDKLPLLLDNALRVEQSELHERVALQGGSNRRSTTLAAASDDLELLDLSRAFDPDRATSKHRSAYVRITRGCNKFCTYCVVPHTRGAEVHRPPDHIVDECRRLADAGVIEVTLLGQTVNHYIYVHGAAVTSNGRELAQVGPGLGHFRSGSGVQKLTAAGSRMTTFADLLARIHDEVPAIKRLRFVTSYPRDFSDEALHVIAQSPRICPYLHVPAQSGSNRILKMMNRGYTVEEYLDFIDRARAIVPGVSIAGDIIVGFPTETDADFDATCDLLRRVRFKNNFIFKYSPRPGTVAIDRFADDVPDEVKRYRNNDLLRLQSEISAAVHQECVGTTVEVMVEQVRPMPESAASSEKVELRWQTHHNENSALMQATGRTPGDLIVAFPVDSSEDEQLPGSIVSVVIESAGPLILFGQALAATAAAGQDARVAG